jgi:Domain of unknown function (DUF4145)
LIVTGNCPHCKTQNVAFQARFQFDVRPERDKVHMLTTCNACRMGVIFSLALYEHSSTTDLVNAIGSQDALKITVRNQWPKADSDAPAFVPPNIGSFFEQGVRALRAGHWDAAGAMFRKTLDTATKAIDSTASSQTLFQRINTLVESGKLTSAMGDWSHEIRLDGNDAVHSENPESEDDATMLQRFTEAFLTYSFTLPAMVASNRARRAEGGKANTG